MCIRDRISTDWLQSSSLFYSSQTFAFKPSPFSSWCLTWFSNNSSSFPSTCFWTLLGTVPGNISFAFRLSVDDTDLYSFTLSNEQWRLVSKITYSGSPLWYMRGRTSPVKVICEMSLKCCITTLTLSVWANCANKMCYLKFFVGTWDKYFLYSSTGQRSGYSEIIYSNFNRI